MQFENFESLVLTRQSCRDFKNIPVEKEKLDKIMSLSLMSPSACNSQPWKLYCANSPEKVDEIRATLQVQDRNKFLDGAKAYIAVVEEDAVLKPWLETKFNKNRFIKYDIGELVAYLTLSAKTVGLDTCIIGWVDEDALSKVLGLNENEACKIVIAVGYSNQPVREKKRCTFEEKVVYID
ncbi:MAG: hypothetical protein E7369_02880 [Clostridiales bacterium]|nr:hypothetical protein [Clostridiales bacterium]